MPDTNLGYRTMKMKLSTLLMFAMLLVVTSCNESKNNQYSSLYDSSESGNEKQEVKEAPKKSEMFYQGLLEQFCLRYYDGCFSGRKYHYNSLIVDKMQVVQGNWENGNIVSWEMLIEGKHSFGGRFKNHNDSPFEAFVNDLGNDTYEVTFIIKRYDIFGDQMKDREEATRKIVYSE